MRFLLFSDLSSSFKNNWAPWREGFGQPLEAGNRPKCFDDHAEEQLYWHECHQQTLKTLKIALALGIFGFFCFITLDLNAGTLNPSDIPKRSLAILLLLGLIGKLHYSCNPYQQIPGIAKVGAYVGLLNLFGILLYEHNPSFYNETWASVLPIFFFTYGQMFISLGESLAFGIGTMLLMPMGGWWIGMNFNELLPSIVLMAVINIFGYHTRLQLEQQTRKLFMARRQAELAAEDKILLLRQIGHNLRQPLQALSCHASVLETLFTDNPNQDVRHYVGRMAIAIDEVNSICNRVLDFAHLELGRQKTIIGNVDINTLLSALEIQFQPLAERQGVKLKVEMRCRPPYQVLTDAAILTQIISNLLDNAVKFTRSGWIVIRAVKIGNRQLKLHIADSGPGIDQRQQAKIFREEIHGHRRGNEHHIQGFGIGLNFVAKAIEQLPMHQLKLYSKVGKGSDFQIFLPVIEPCTPEKAIVPQCPQPLQGLLALLVDDDPCLLDGLSKYLLQCGCQVEAATNPTQLKLALRDCLAQPDFLITDYYLNDEVTALDIISLVEAECGPVPTIILSALAIPNHVKQALPTNVSLLRKPASTGNLRLTIDKLLNSRAD